MTLILECSARRLIIIADSRHKYTTFFLFPARYIWCSNSAKCYKLSWFPSHSGGAILIPPSPKPPYPSSVAQVSPPTPLNSNALSKMTPDFLVYGPSGEISVCPTNSWHFVSFPLPFLTVCCLVSHIRVVSYDRWKKYAVKKLHLLNIIIF